MIVDDRGRQVLGGGGVLPVEVHALGAELRRLWQEGADPAGGDSSAITRACTRNLVVLCEDEEAARHAATMIAGVADRYPSRAFVVCRVEGDDRLEATLEAQCVRLPGGRHVCCEQVGLRVGRSAGRRAASAIVPLLVPDLPVFVWSLVAPAWEDEFLTRVLGVADRMLVDSRACPDPVRLLAELAARDRVERWAPSDFEWARLSGWREAVATLFEDPSMTGARAAVSRIAVRHGSAGRPGAALLAGWILDRLEVAGLAGPGPDAIVLESIGGTGGIASLSLTAGDGTRLEVESMRNVLHLSLVAPGACAFPGGVPCERGPAESLLEDLLAEHVAEPLYERALARAAVLLGAPLGA